MASAQAGDTQAEQEEEAEPTPFHDGKLKAIDKPPSRSSRKKAKSSSSSNRSPDVAVEADQALPPLLPFDEEMQNFGRTTRPQPQDWHLEDADKKAPSIHPGSVKDKDWVHKDKELGMGLENSYGVSITTRSINKEKELRRKEIRDLENLDCTPDREPPAKGSADDTPTKSSLSAPNSPKKYGKVGVRFAEGGPLVRLFTVSGEGDAAKRAIQSAAKECTKSSTGQAPVKLAPQPSAALASAQPSNSPRIQFTPQPSIPLPSMAFPSAAPLPGGIAGTSPRQLGAMQTGFNGAQFPPMSILGGLFSPSPRLPPNTPAPPVFTSSPRLNPSPRTLALQQQQQQQSVSPLIRNTNSPFTSTPAFGQMAASTNPFSTSGVNGGFNSASSGIKNETQEAAHPADTDPYYVEGNAVNWALVCQRVAYLQDLPLALEDTLRLDDMFEAAELYAMTFLSPAAGTEPQDSDAADEDGEGIEYKLPSILSFLRAYSRYQGRIAQGESRADDELEELLVGLEEVFQAERSAKDLTTYAAGLLDEHADRIEALREAISGQFVPEFLLSSDFAAYFELKRAEAPLQAGSEVSASVDVVHVNTKELTSLYVK